MFTILKKLKYLIICHYKGHRYGVTQITDKHQHTVCARCGFEKKRKFSRKITQDEFYFH